jgi:hypothetical protein
MKSEMHGILNLLCTILLISDAYPLWRAWRANRATSLSHTLAWACLAWLSWVCTFVADTRPGGGSAGLRYLSLCLTDCAVVAVLGARRPGVVAWNFVVCGLLAVTLLPLAESAFLRDTLEVPGNRMILVAAIIGAGVLNYLPTRLAPAAVMLAVGCGVEILIAANLGEASSRWSRVAPVSRFLLAFSPWAAFVSLEWRPVPRSMTDEIWRDYRDRFGLIWAQRLREQFNRSAANAGWPVYLYWQGLRRTPGAPPPSPSQHEAIIETLKALMKRFGQ